MSRLFRFDDLLHRFTPPASRGQEIVAGTPPRSISHSDLLARRRQKAFRATSFSRGARAGGVCESQFNPLPTLFGLSACDADEVMPPARKWLCKPVRMLRRDWVKRLDLRVPHRPSNRDGMQNIRISQRPTAWSRRLSYAKPIKLNRQEGRRIRCFLLGSTMTTGYCNHADSPPALKQHEKPALTPS